MSFETGPEVVIFGNPVSIRTEYGMSLNLPITTLGDLKDGTRPTAWIQDSKVSYQVFGTIDSVAEIGEQLAWLSTALRFSPKERGIVYCCPFISALATGTLDPTRFWIPASYN